MEMYKTFLKLEQMCRKAICPFEQTYEPIAVRLKTNIYIVI